MIKLRKILSAVIGACAATSCSGPAPRQECGLADSHWLKSSDEPYGYALRVNVRRNGSIIWDGHPVSRQDMLRYLTATRALNPRPYLVLEYEAGLDCAELERMRREFNERAQCGTEGLCAEKRLPQS
jgi:hypothetical protein